jgi:hypothetical protein
MQRFTILQLLAISAICLTQCKNPTPRENAERSVKAYLLDSLKQQSLNVTYEDFDTVTRFDSLMTVLYKITNDSITAEAELKKIQEAREYVGSLSQLNDLFGDSNHDDEAAVSQENLNTSETNYRYALRLMATRRSNANEELKKLQVKSQVSRYSLKCGYQLNENVQNLEVTLDPTFKVVSATSL